MLSYTHRCLWLCVGGLLLAGSCLPPTAAWCCDTPVYRFSMYSDSWAPWPYAAFYLHQGEIPAADSALHQRLAAFESEIPQRTNLVVHAINVNEATVWDELPPAVRKVWDDSKAIEPLWVVMPPHAPTPIFTGRLTDALVAALIDSPVRQQIGKAQEQGKMVALLLEGSNEAENKAVNKVLSEVAQQAAAGQIEGDSLPLGIPPQRDPAAKPNVGELSLEIASIVVSRTDPREQFLVAMLMAVEPDLDRFADRSMVFLAYGRGRVLPPYIGAGITKDNLIHESGVQFLLGPCSCEIKGQNPGADLLTTWDWRGSATKLARRFGEEEGNEDLLGISSLVPTLSLGMPGEKQADESASKQPGSITQTNIRAALDEVSDSKAVDDKLAAGSKLELPSTSLSPSQAEADSLNRSMSLYLGIGIGASALLMIVVGLVVWRRSG